MQEPLVASVMLEEDPTRSVARVALAATFYIHDMEPWEHGGAEAASRAFFEICPPKNLRWFTTSRLDKWNCLHPTTVRDVVSHLTWPETRIRHCFGFWLADDPGAPHCAFGYRAIDTTRGGRAGYLQIFLPQDTDPGLLWQAVLAVAHRWPITCGIAGYGASWSRLYPQTAFHEIRAWSRRYYGLDVQEPERMSWHVRDAVPGTSWLTLLGPELLRAWREDERHYLDHPWNRPDITGIELANGGVLIRAGARPTLADLNRLAYPDAYAEVARKLAGRFVAEPTPFTGGFFEHGDTVPWFRRFLEPESWR